MTATIETTTKEDPLLLADRRAREMADHHYGPITLTPKRYEWWNLYWGVMAGHGYRPYYPGCQI